MCCVRAWGAKGGEGSGWESQLGSGNITNTDMPFRAVSHWMWSKSHSMELWSAQITDPGCKPGSIIKTYYLRHGPQFKQFKPFASRTVNGSVRPRGSDGASGPSPSGGPCHGWPPPLPPRPVQSHRPQTCPLLNQYTRKPVNQWTRQSNKLS